jgi:hypothetical protein
MNQEIGNLIDECKKLEPEIHRLLLIQLSFYPPWMIRKVKRISKEKLTDLRREGGNLGGLHETERKCDDALDQYNKILSQLAAFLEETGFEIKQFRNQLSGPQFRWLSSKRIEIKQHLKGIDII